MSFTLIEQATPRLHRSELAVPGSNTAHLREGRGKAPPTSCSSTWRTRSHPMTSRRRARTSSRRSTRWTGAAKTMMIRINGLDTHYMYRDVVDIVEACPRLDMVLIPKVGVAADVYAVDMLVTQIEQALGRTKKHRLRSADRDRAGHGQRRGHRAEQQAGWRR